MESKWWEVHCKRWRNEGKRQWRRFKQHERTEWISRISRAGHKKWKKKNRGVTDMMCVSQWEEWARASFSSSSSQWGISISAATIRSSISLSLFTTVPKPPSPFFCLASLSRLLARAALSLPPSSILWSPSVSLSLSQLHEPIKPLSLMRPDAGLIISWRGGG